jgi:hypothetical protein
MGRLGTLNPRHLVHLWGIFDLNICRGYMRLYQSLFTHPFCPFGGQFQRDLEFHHAVGSISTPKHMGPRWVRVVWVNLKIGVLSTSRHRWLRIGIRVPMDPLKLVLNRPSMGRLMVLICLTHKLMMLNMINPMFWRALTKSFEHM